MDKSKIWIFVLLIIMIACGMILTFLVAQGMKDDGFSETPTQETSHNYKVGKGKNTSSVIKEEEIKKEEELPKEELQSIEDIYQMPKEEEKEVMDESTAKRLENIARRFFRSASFTEGVQSLYDATERYSREGYGETIHELYEDGSFLINFEYLSENVDGHAGSLESMAVTLQSIRDPEMALLGMLAVDLEHRNQLLPSVDSLNPAFEGVVKILSKSTVEGRDLNEFSAMYDVKTLHRIDFNIEGYNLYAYVIENSEGYSHVAEIRETEEGTTPFLTVAEWNKLIKK